MAGVAHSTPASSLRRAPHFPRARLAAASQIARPGSETVRRHPVQEQSRRHPLMFGTTVKVGSRVVPSSVRRRAFPLALGGSHPGLSAGQISRHQGFRSCEPLLEIKNGHDAPPGSPLRRRIGRFSIQASISNSSQQALPPRSRERGKVPGPHPGPQCWKGDTDAVEDFRLADQAGHRPRVSRRT